jgi:hypothetical protein
VCVTESIHLPGKNADETDDIDTFMKLPSLEEKKMACRAFYKATSNEALAMKVCVICARELMASEGDHWVINDLPNIRELLVPSRGHKDHILWNGLLLLVNHISSENNEATGWACHECCRSLKKGKRPPLSLANNLWIGEVPHVLSVLTIPEQMLIARHFPRFYVFKLYPKSGNRHCHPDHLQRGMCGNVSLYDLVTQAITDMLAGHFLPQPGALLASVMAITFVGSKRLPKNWLKSTFRVRRRRVYEALLWLKENNPLYTDIEISNERLAQLPEDGIPEEIVAIVGQQPNGDLAIKEAAGLDFQNEIVIDQAENGGKIHLSCCSIIYSMPVENNNLNPDVLGEECVESDEEDEAVDKVEGK